MAEGGKPFIQKFSRKITIRSKERKTIVYGDKVETEHETRAEECGALAASGSGEDSKEEKLTFAEALAQLSPGSKKSEEEKKLDDITNRAQNLIGDSKYEAATSLLKSSGVLKLDVYLPKLLSAECYLCMGIVWKGLSVIDKLKKTMTSSELKAGDLIDIANDFIVGKLYIRAIILLRIVSDMYVAKAPTSDGAVNGIQLCCEHIYSAITQLIETGGELLEIGVYFGTTYMKEILSALGSVKNVSPENIALNEAWCHYYIGDIHDLVEKIDKSKKYLKLGVWVLYRQFGPHASKYPIYGYLLNNLGNAYQKLGKYSRQSLIFPKPLMWREKLQTSVIIVKNKDIPKSQNRI